MATILSGGDELIQHYHGCGDIEAATTVNKKLQRWDNPCEMDGIGYSRIPGAQFTNMV